MVLGIGNPVVRVHVLYAEQVEGVKPKPYVAEMALPTIMDGTFLVVDKSIAHAYVDTAIGRGSEDESFASRVWRPEGESVGVYGAEVHLPAVRTGEVVGEAE